MTIEPGLFALAVIAAAAAGIAIGRWVNPIRHRIDELRSKLEKVSKERELAEAALASAKDEMARLRTEREEYGNRVVEHFRDTSDLMRDLTVQYRAVYDQLTKGATSLCPEGSVGLQSGLEDQALEAGEPGEAGEPKREGA